MVKSYVEGAGGAGPREESVRYDVGPYVLTLITLSFLTRNASATHRVRSRAAEFLGRVDPALYEDNPAVAWNLALAKGVARAWARGSHDLPSVRHRVMEDQAWADWHEAFFENYESGGGHAVEGETLENELSDEQVRWADEYVSTRLRYTYLWRARPALREIVARMEANDIGLVSEFSDQVQGQLEELVRLGRAARSTGGSGAVDFRTGDLSFEAAVRSAHRERNRPQSVVRTGVRLLNDMLGGGYSGGRLYVHFGMSGDWKSGLLCSAAFWAIDPRFNPGYTCKDPTRKPVVLFITQENDYVETIERMISYAIGSEVDLRGSSEEEMVRRLVAAYSSETCGFSFKYRQNRAISTSDVAAMVEDEYMEGNEVVLVVHDYIKRVKSTEQFRDQRHLELGAVVDELSSMVAKAYGIPVVTGMQFNRGAYEILEKAAKTGRTDAVKELGASNAGESLNVFENADVVIMQRRVFMESTGTTYLTARRAKMRGKKRSGPDYFAQPFARDLEGRTNEMLLAQDAHLDERECAGSRDLGNAMAEEYDANAPAGGSSREERRADRAERDMAEVAGRGAARPAPARLPGAPQPPAARRGGPSRRAAASAPPGGFIEATLGEEDPPARGGAGGLGDL